MFATLVKSLSLLLAIIICGSVLDLDSKVKAQSLTLVPHKISLANGKTFTLNIPKGFDIEIAGQGMRRIRFFAQSPDNRIFLTDMYNRADSKRGSVYVLEGFNPATGKFAAVKTYLTGLRNPNSVAFYTDKSGQDWFYLALTDRLVRYRYQRGEEKPSGKPEVLATFPDYGLSYKYGGWHLTRSIQFDNSGKLYVSVGSSCNACVEKEAIRASIVEMNPDGSDQRTIATNIRNAVGLEWVGGKLYATDMGDDHLGDDRPEDTLYAIVPGTNYGWPYCYQYKGRVYADPKFAGLSTAVDCKKVPLAFTGFAAHSSPLGLQYFDSNNTALQLRDSFLVALHGSSKEILRRGYRLVRVRKGSLPEDFITGFKQGPKIYGRPCGILKLGGDAFLFTDDYAGVVYYVHKSSN